MATTATKAPANKVTASQKAKAATTSKSKTSKATPATEDAAPEAPKADEKVVLSFRIDKQEISSEALNALEELPEATPANRVNREAIRGDKNVGRPDGYTLDPLLIQVAPGTNPRVKYSKDDESWDEFKMSIAPGVRMPVQVYALKNDAGEVKYHLAQGFRRLKAVHELLAANPDMITLKKIPVEFVQYDRERILAEHVTLNNALPLEDIELVRIMEQFQTWGYTVKETSGILFMPEPKVRRLLEFSKKASKKLRDLVEAGKVSMTSAIEFVRKTTDTVKQTQILNKAEESQAAAEAEAAPVAPEAALPPAAEAPKAKSKGKAPEATTAEATTAEVAVTPAPTTQAPPAPQAAPAAEAPKAPAKPANKPGLLVNHIEGMKKINTDKSLDKLLDYLTREQQQSPDEIDLAKVDFFKEVVKMVRADATELQILRALFQVNK